MNKKNRRIVATVLLLAFVLWIVLTLFPSQDSSIEGDSGSVPEADKMVEPSFTKEGEAVLVKVPEGDTLKVLEIEIADNQRDRNYGMMYRKSIDENTGMLFLMETERRQSFYMKNTYVPLDIIYINSDNEIVNIIKNAEPLKERSLPSEGPASMVLEVKGGFSDKYGLEPGDKLRWKRIR